MTPTATTKAFGAWGGSFSRVQDGMSFSERVRAKCSIVKTASTESAPTSKIQDNTTIKSSSPPKGPAQDEKAVRPPTASQVSVPALKTIPIVEHIAKTDVLQEAQGKDAVERRVESAEESTIQIVPSPLPRHVAYSHQISPLVLEPLVERQVSGTYSFGTFMETAIPLQSEETHSERITAAFAPDAVTAPLTTFSQDFHTTSPLGTPDLKTDAETATRDHVNPPYTAPPVLAKDEVPSHPTPQPIPASTTDSARGKYVPPRSYAALSSDTLTASAPAPTPSTHHPGVWNTAAVPHPHRGALPMPYAPSSAYPSSSSPTSASPR
eukprot:CAMPEP_0201491382 /NCGR_PEP_ID=MMETSP0151_2-20130828/29655_1 /ASSEMBLY_ACC=CAM_ASM_000257 /TAXON_ID=200890 /ORGANISM="Paramoeba atlantica, Strain 621/1 / CCAP 1560/9" /LENGTH=322 /DNA_ID=CAMNT_0047877719 /DNA_START=95 /DNA_END=1059 /DNA_ORIENTATION=-